MVPDPAGGTTPAAGITVVALPFDPDSALSATALRTARPHISLAEFDSLRALFRGPFDSYQATERAYESAKAAHHDTLALAALREAAARLVHLAGETVLPRLTALNDSLAAWEKDTYTGWDSLRDSWTAPRRGLRLVDTTRADGSIHLRLDRKRYWLWARADDPADPFSTWTWSVRVDRDTLLLAPPNARSGPRIR